MGTLYNIKAAVISWFSDIRIYKGGFVLFGESSYQIKGNEMREILDLIQPGDILLRRYSHYIGSLLIPGYFSHAAVYVGNNEIIHMLGDGINKEDILIFLRCDDIALLRSKTPELAQRIVQNAKMYLEQEIKYDYNFKVDDNKKFYCTEFVDKCAENIVLKSLKKRITVMPDDFLNETLFNIIWNK
jgi:hypothetical protein